MTGLHDGRPDQSREWVSVSDTARNDYRQQPDVGEVKTLEVTDDLQK